MAQVKIDDNNWHWWFDRFNNSGYTVGPDGTRTTNFYEAWGQDPHTAPRALTPLPPKTKLSSTTLLMGIVVVGGLIYYNK